MRNHLRYLPLLACLTAGSAVAAEPVYKCTDVKGNQVFASKPCDQIRRPDLPPMEAVEREMTKIDQIDRRMASIKREIRTQRMELSSELHTIYAQEAATKDQITRQAKVLEEEYNERIDELSRELAVLGDARNRLVEQSVSVFLDDPF